MDWMHGSNFFFLGAGKTQIIIEREKIGGHSILAPVMFRGGSRYYVGMQYPGCALSPLSPVYECRRRYHANDDTRMPGGIFFFLIGLIRVPCLLRYSMKTQNLPQNGSSSSFAAAFVREASCTLELVFVPSHNSCVWSALNKHVSTKSSPCADRGYPIAIGRKIRSVGFARTGS